MCQDMIAFAILFKTSPHAHHRITHWGKASTLSGLGTVKDIWDVSELCLVSEGLESTLSHCRFAHLGKAST